MNKFKGLLIFTSGLAVGSVVTATLLKKYYEEVAQAEIDSVKEIFTYRKTETGEPVEEEHSDVNNENASSIAKAAKEKKDITDYTKYYKSESEVEDGDTEEDVPEPNDSDEELPYVISPEEFGIYDEEYERISLTYFSDGILADDANNELSKEEIEDLVGLDSITHFGEHEDDAVHVRNDRLKTDYEILRDLRTYEEVVGANVYGY